MDDDLDAFLYGDESEAQNSKDSGKDKLAEDATEAAADVDEANDDDDDDVLLVQVKF
jgi:predicted  nucleic acid-binding Zn-ribbon protein